MSKKHGGARPGAGAKKKKFVDRKIRLTIWPTGAMVRKVGGEKQAKVLAMNALQQAEKIS